MFLHHGDRCRIVAMHCVAGHVWCSLGGRASTTSTERMRELRPVTWSALVGQNNCDDGFCLPWFGIVDACGHGDYDQNLVRRKLEMLSSNLPDLRTMSAGQPRNAWTCKSVQRRAAQAPILDEVLLYPTDPY